MTSSQAHSPQKEILVVTHRFARAAESGDIEEIAALLAQDVTFHTPILTQDLDGKELTLRFISEAARIIGGLMYTDEATDAERTFLFWNGTVDQREISGVTVLVEESQGQVADIPSSSALGESSPTSETRCSAPWLTSSRRARGSWTKGRRLRQTQMPAWANVRVESCRWRPMSLSTAPC